MSDPILQEPEIQPEAKVETKTKPAVEKITCVCGSTYSAKNKSNHEKTQKHQSYIGSGVPNQSPLKGKKLKVVKGKSENPEAEIKVFRVEDDEKSPRERAGSQSSRKRPRGKASLDSLQDLLLEVLDGIDALQDGLELLVDGEASDLSDVDE